MEMENTSGQGAASVVPDEIKGWNWGAFLMNWIWSIGNQTWIGLLARATSSRAPGSSKRWVAPGMMITSSVLHRLRTAVS